MRISVPANTLPRTTIVHCRAWDKPLSIDFWLSGQIKLRWSSLFSFSSFAAVNSSSSSDMASRPSRIRSVLISFYLRIYCSFPFKMPMQLLWRDCCGKQGRISADRSDSAGGYRPGGNSWEWTIREEDSQWMFPPAYKRQK